ncbi:MAG: T9SS type A sorting domain-containing protein [Bacteroidota bacterium]
MKRLMKASWALWLMVVALDVCGQSTIRFEYDPSGNRVLRHVENQAKNTEEALVNLADSLPREFEANDRVYPNPTEGIVTFSLRLEEPSPSRVTVFDLNGRMIYRRRFEEQAFEIDITTAKIGVYLVKWQFAQQTRTVKIIKN